MARPATLVIPMDVTNTAATGNIAYIAVRQVQVRPVTPATRMAVTKGKTIASAAAQQSAAKHR